MLKLYNTMLLKKSDLNRTLLGKKSRKIEFHNLMVYMMLTNYYHHHYYLLLIRKIVNVSDSKINGTWSSYRKHTWHSWSAMYHKFHYSSNRKILNKLHEELIKTSSLYESSVLWYKDFSVTSYLKVGHEIPFSKIHQQHLLSTKN